MEYRLGPAIRWRTGGPLSALLSEWWNRAEVNSLDRCLI